MNLQPIQYASAPARSKTSLPSGAPAEHLTFGAMLEERWKIEEEEQLKEEGKQKRKVNHRAENSKKKAQKSVLHVKSKKNTIASIVLLNLS